MSAAMTSPSKEKSSGDWVKFDETDGDGSRATSSGVSSARGQIGKLLHFGTCHLRTWFLILGSVNSVVTNAEDQGVLPVSQVEVVDEKSIKQTKVNKDEVVFKQVSVSATASPLKRASQNLTDNDTVSMDNVNLSDESPNKSSDLIRGRRFRKCHIAKMHSLPFLFR